MTILTEQYEFKNVDWTIAAGGEARDGDTAISLSGVTGNIRSALLYWGELNFSGSSDNTINFNGSSISGERLGTSVDTCWGSDHSIGYFADVSDYVSGNGTFPISGMGQGGQGASLVVFYDDGDISNNRDVTTYAGNDATNVRSQTDLTTRINLGNVEYESGDVQVTFNVGDGQSFTDGALTINGTQLGSNLFPGSTGELRSVPNGSLWDVVETDITSQLSTGNNDVRVAHESGQDCLQFVSVIVDKPAEAPALFLDFDSAIPLDFHVQKANVFGFGNKEAVGEKSGSEPLGQFTSPQETQLVQYVQDIFDRSGIAMDVTSTRPQDGEYHTVRFSSEKLVYDENGDGTDDARLLGKAYEGIDRFNTDKSDMVAVFMDGGDPLLSVAETTTHEAAHAFGGRHINPTQGSGSEVLDYDDSGLEAFVDSPANITEPPVDGQSSRSTTHNPTYHIRRFVGDESEDQLRFEGIEGGTWDRGFFSNIFYSLGIGDLSDDLTNLSLLIPDISDRVEGDNTETLGNLTLLAEDVSQGEEISFSLPEGTPFKIVASSTDSSVIDVVMEVDPSSDEPFTTTANRNDSISGSFVSGQTEEQLSRFGSFSLSVTDVEVVRAQGAEVTPELSITTDKEAISESGDTATVTISRGSNVEGDLEVILASDDTSEALVPNNVVIPDGQSAIDVTLEALDDVLRDGTQTATITALAEDYNNGVATISVLDDETPRLNVSIDPNSISEDGDVATATITRTSGTFGEVEVSLSSNDVSEATVANSAVIGSGDTSGEVTVSAVDDQIFDGDQNVSISASAVGFQSGSESLTVKDNESPELSVVLAPDSISEKSGAATATISRNSGTEGDLTVTVSSSDVSEAVNASTVTILDGEASVDVEVNAVDDNEVDGTQIVSFTASADGFLDGTDSIEVVDNDEDVSANEIRGTDGRDNLRGTDGPDQMISLGGSYDRMAGSGGADEFIFGAEATNGVRERDVISNFDVAEDSIVLRDGASVAESREQSDTVVLSLDDGNDVAYIRGDGVSLDTVNIVDENLLV